MRRGPPRFGHAPLPFYHPAPHKIETMPSIQRTLLVATVVAALFFLRSGSPNEGPPACIEAPGAWKATFIDLGANSGDSFLGFMDDPSVNWPFTFPRPCGFQKSDFKAWLFEANKAFDEPLAALSKIFAKEKGMKVNIMGRTVVSVADGPASFSADGRVEPNCNRCVGYLRAQLAGDQC